MSFFTDAYTGKHNSVLYPCVAISSVLCAVSNFGKELISARLFVKYGEYVLAISFIVFLIYSFGTVIGNMTEESISKKCKTKIAAILSKIAMCVGLVAATTFIVIFFTR